MPFDVSKLGNGKYAKGNYAEFEQRKGWFIGSFFEADNPSRTDQIEVQYKEQSAGHVCKAHYHEHKIEIILMLKGKAVFTVNADVVKLVAGEFLFIDINNVVEGEFIEDSTYFSIHSPSIPTDKVVVRN